MSRRLTRGEVLAEAKEVYGDQVKIRKTRDRENYEIWRIYEIQRVGISLELIHAEGRTLADLQKKIAADL